MLCPGCESLGCAGYPLDPEALEDAMGSVLEELALDSRYDLEEGFDVYHVGPRTIFVYKGTDITFESRELCPCSHPETPVLPYLQSIVNADVRQIKDKPVFRGREIYLIEPSDKSAEIIGFSDLTPRELLQVGVGTGIRMPDFDGSRNGDLIEYRTAHLHD